MLYLPNLPPEGSVATGNMQTVKDCRVKRTLHVWARLPGKSVWKCVLCGGLSKQPSDDADCDSYEKLTAEERKLCPPDSSPQRQGEKE